MLWQLRILPSRRYVLSKVRKCVSLFLSLLHACMYLLTYLPLYFSVLDATQLVNTPSLQKSSYDKVFSNAAMHWILATSESQQRAFFQGVHAALKPHGKFCFEMGGFGNVAEMRAALLGAVGRRVGIERAREVDPWFFSDETWMRGMLEDKEGGGVGGFRVEKIELEYRPTKADAGGIEGWVRLMGKQFFDAVAPEGNSKREECIKEVGDVLKSVVNSPGGGEWIGYVRLRVLASKI